MVGEHHPLQQEEVVLITGGAGFLGSVLTRSMLQRGTRVRVLDTLEHGPQSVRPFLGDPRYELIRGDITLPRDLDGALEGVSRLVHLAALVGDVPCDAHPAVAQRVNVAGTDSVFKRSAARGVRRIVFASTCSVYGVQLERVLADETTNLNPASLYARTKIRCEELASGYRESKMSIVSLRLATAYGVSARTRSDLLVNSLTMDALRTRRILLYAPGSWRPYAHVNDIGAAIIRALEAPDNLVGGETFNVVSQNLTKMDVARKIAARTGAQIDVSETRGDDRNYRVTGQKIALALGFRPQLSLEETLSEIVFAAEIGAL